MCVLSTAAFADVASEFSKGKNAYLYGDFRKVVAILEPLVGSPQTLPPDLDRKDAYDALEYLGLSHFYLGNEPAAKLVFEKLILADPKRMLSPVTAPPEAVALYNQLKAQLEDEIEKRLIAINKRREEEALKNRIRIETKQRRNSKLVALMPFGVGQFQNDDPLWGGVFLGTELVAVSLSVAFFFAAENLRQPDGFFDPADVDRARGFRIGQIAAGGAAAALMIGGMVHAWLTFKPEVRTDYKVIDPKKSRVTPTLNPNGLGVMFEF